MFKIIKKEVLSSVIKSFEIEAKDIAKNIKAGQFIVLRLDEKGERFPLTVAGKDLEKGTIKIIFQLKLLILMLIIAKIKIILYLKEIICII